MVVARTKLMIHDDLLRPSPSITIHFTGPDPDRFYKEIPNLMRAIFRAGEHSIQEKRFKWIKGDPEKFDIKWELDKDLDKFSYYFVEVSLRGHNSRGNGSADIVVDGALRTEYPQDTMWQKSILYEMLRVAWHNIYYHSKRDHQLTEGRRLMALFVDKLKSITR